jgi:asparaginyl-tRNA synthetase
LLSELVLNEEHQVGYSRAKHAQSWKDPQGHYLRVLEDPWYRTLAEIQNRIFVETVRFFELRGYRAVQLPITTTSISSPMGLGSDSSPVIVSMFGVETYLADSMQFMLEYACRLSGTNTFYIMPSFRGDDPDETHLNQFYHNEAELVGGLDDVVNLVDSYLRALTRSVLEHHADGIGSICGSVKHIEVFSASNAPIPRISFDEACAILDMDPALVRRHPKGFRTLTRQGEAKLNRELGGAVWLTDFDHLSVPFYQAFDSTRTKAKAADLLLAGIGEVVGAGERHATSVLVAEALDMHQVSHKSYEWYLEMKARHPLQTSGFGLGVERFLGWLLSCSDIRECQILPRLKGVEMVP